MSRVEAYGVYGMKRKAWRRVFASFDILRRWCDAHDAEVLGTREVTDEEWRSSRRRAA